MKKILLIGAFVISAVSFSNTFTGQRGAMMNNGTGSVAMMQGGSGMMGGNGMRGGKGMMQGGGMMRNMTPEQRIAMQNDMIAIHEKQLEVRKLMNTANPNMEKIGALNTEINNMRVNHMTNMQNNMGSFSRTN